MKADSKTQNEVISTLKKMFDAYQKRNLTGMLSVMASDPDVMVIGSGADERSIGPNAFGKSAKRDWAQSEAASITLGETSVSALGAIAWFAADITFRFAITGKESKLSGRLTGVLEKRMGKWLVMQLHFSTPSAQQAQGQSWPQA
jgi:ketosteroid isomerase-like protein